jgi:hypothetical protein
MTPSAWAAFFRRSVAERPEVKLLQFMVLVALFWVSGLRG